MNAKAQEIADAIKPGSVLVTVGKNYRPGQEVTVSHFKGKSVYFTDGMYENLRSLHNYAIKSI